MEIYVAGIPLVLVVMALVEWIKKLGVTGIWTNVVSMIVGVLIGIGYQLSLKMPVTFSEWFTAIIFGLALGLTASGVYDVGKTLVTRITDKQ